MSNFYGCMILSYMDNHNVFNKTRHWKYSYCFHSCCVFLSSLMGAFPLNVAYYIMVCIFFFFDVLLCNYFRAKLFFWVWVCPWNLCVGNFILCRMLMMGGEASGRRMNHESPAFLNGTTHSWTERVLRQWQRELAILRKGLYEKPDWPVFISVLPYETRLETL